MTQLMQPKTRTPRQPVTSGYAPRVRCGRCPGLWIVLHGRTATEALTAHYQAVGHLDDLV